MARSDRYKNIIIVLAFFVLLGCIILGIGMASGYSGFLESSSSILTSSEIESASNTVGFIIFLVFLILGFIFCMFFYLLADILDRLEIISAQTVRSTKVLENFEDKQEEKEETK